jgi:hypothetical protein
MTTRSAAPTAPKAGDGEPALKYVQANGLRFAYLEQGSGPLVIFMHGFPDNAWSYRKQLQAFADARGRLRTGSDRDDGPRWRFRCNGSLANKRQTPLGRGSGAVERCG